MKIYSYVVRYDSGFAPNPFFKYCTLATCKPLIREKASIGDWIVGCGSADKNVRRGGHLVYAMKVTEALDFHSYSLDPRFRQKIPYRNGSRKQSCGDNIYYRNAANSEWLQRDSFHSKEDGNLNPLHVARDTKVDRVLISNDYVYFGGYGPIFPEHLRNFDGLDVCKSGIGFKTFCDSELISHFNHWIRSLGVSGYQAAPFEWRMLRGQ